MSEHSYPEVNDEGKVICQICGRPFLVISVTHLKKHGITLDQYRTRYPNMPISSKTFKSRGKFGRMGLFKKESKKELEDVIEDDGLPEKKVEHVAVPTVENIDDFSKSFKVESPNDPITKKKQEIIEYLRGIFPNVQENYFIQKVSLSGHLEYEFITDFADPLLKVDFEFPNTFWHNKNRYVNVNRNKILRSDGWKVVEIQSNYPSLKMLEEAVKSF